MKFWATLVFILLSSSKAMASSLSIPLDFEFLAINGKKIESRLFSHQTQLPLPIGEHQIAIRYSDMIEDDHSDSQSHIISSPFIITLIAEKNQSYQLRPLDGDTVKRPKQFAKKPEVIVENQQNNDLKVSYSITYTQLTESSFADKLFTAITFDKQNIAENSPDIYQSAALATTTQTKQVAAQIIKAATIIPVQANKPATQNTESQHANTMLQYWWQQADPQTQAQFLQWIASQKNE